MLDTAKKNLEKNGFKVIVVKDKQGALEVAKKFINKGMSIGLGGSETVKSIGVYDYLLSLDNITLYNQYEVGIDMEENTKRRRQGLLSDLFISSANAITQNGEIVNADGSGNRVAAQIFGPKEVLLFVTTNKIVKNIDEGFERISKVAMVKNVERVNQNAVLNGKEPTYNLENIANKFTYVNADEEGRTSIVFITNEEFGY